MKSAISLLIVILFSLTMSCSDKMNTASEKNRVRVILDKYAEAWRTKDIDLFDELFSDDAEMVIFDGNSSQRIIGWEAWKQRLQKHFELFEDVDVSYEEVTIQVGKSGKVAWLSCIANTRYFYQGESATMSGLRITMVLEQRRAGWVIVHAHFSFPRE